MGNAAEDDRLKDEGSEDDEDNEAEAASESKAEPSDDSESKKEKAPKKADREKGAKKRASSGGKASTAKASGTARAPRQGAMAKSMVLFFAIVCTLGVALWFLGREEGGGGEKKVTWAKGQKVDVEITLVHTDQQDLAC